MSERGPFRPQVLAPSTPSLAVGVPPGPPPPPGTLYVLAAHGGFAAPPKDGFAVLFGRNTDEVHVGVGGDDDYISRCHGRLICHGREWWLRNEGKLPIRLRSDLLLQGNEWPLPGGYTPLFIPSERREHLFEVRIVDARPAPPADVDPARMTTARRTWTLSEREQLVLTALAQRYLRQDRRPQPLSYQQVALELNALTGRPEWSHKRVENIVIAVRNRLKDDGVPGLTREEVGDPPGNKLNENLIRELLETTTLVPPDLRLLADPDDADDL